MIAPHPQATLGRVILFSLASNAAVLGVMEFGLALWPEHLPVNTQNVFWLALAALCLVQAVRSETIIRIDEYRTCG